MENYSLKSDLKNCCLVESHAGTAKRVPLKVLAVDDHPVIMMGVKALLEADNYATVVECPDFRNLSNLIAKHSPDTILIDMHMPRFDLERDFRLLKKRHPDEIYIAYTADEDPATIRRCRELGFSGYILKSSHFETTKREIDAILAGKELFPDIGSGQARTLLPLSDSQLEILRLMASGHKNREIAEILGVQDVTVDYHKRRIKDILSVKSSLEAIALAKTQGWI